MKLSQSYVEMLMKQAERISGSQYQCSHCYRPSVKPEHIAVVSKGEAICKFCVEGK